MKKFVVAGLLGVVLVGGGCVAKPTGSVETSSDGTSISSGKVVEGVWHLQFRLPSDWVMVPQYDEDSVTDVTTLKLTNKLTDVVVQSTNKPIALTGQSDLPEGSYVTSGYTYMRVLRLAKSAVVPSEAEDLGDNLFRLSDSVNTTYYLKSEYATYKFVVYTNGMDIAEAESVIRTAEEVTSFR